MTIRSNSMLALTLGAVLLAGACGDDDGAEQLPHTGVDAGSPDAQEPPTGEPDATPPLPPDAAPEETSV